MPAWPLKLGGMTVSFVGTSMLCSLLLALLDLQHSLTCSMCAGQNGCRPPNMTCNMDTASLEFSSFDPERHLDGCAHDMWGFGTMIMMMFGRVANWKVPRTLDRQGDYLKLHAHHCDWVGLVLLL